MAMFVQRRTTAGRSDGLHLRRKHIGGFVRNPDRESARDQGRGKRFRKK